MALTVLQMKNCRLVDEIHKHGVSYRCPTKLVIAYAASNTVDGISVKSMLVVEYYAISFKKPVFRCSHTTHSLRCKLFLKDYLMHYKDKTGAQVLQVKLNGHWEFANPEQTMLLPPKE